MRGECGMRNAEIGMRSRSQASGVRGQWLANPNRTLPIAVRAGMPAVAGAARRREAAPRD